MVLNRRNTPEPEEEQGKRAREGGGDRRVWSVARRHPQRGEGLEFTLGEGEKVPPGTTSKLIPVSQSFEKLCPGIRTGICAIAKPNSGLL